MKLHGLIAIFCFGLIALTAGAARGDDEAPHSQSTEEHAYSAKEDSVHADDHHAEEHGDDHGGGAHGHDEHHAHIGDPEHEPAVFEPKDWRYDLSAYSLVVFLLLLAVLKKFAWGPVMAALDDREENIRRNIEEAESARVRSEELMAERSQKLDAVQDEVREILAEARRDAEHTKTEILAKAQQEAEATKGRALDEIDRARDQALNDLFGSMSTQVARATEQVIGRALSDDDRNRLVNESLAELNPSS